MLTYAADQAVWTAFPPGKSGGLIEASHTRTVRVAGAECFRRVNPAASLKRPPVLPSAPSSASFPPGKSGGLIEAVDQAAAAAVAEPGFRRVNPAASLKHAAHRDDGRVGDGGFRRVNPAASLKHGRAAQLGARFRMGFRRVNPAASLKPEKGIAMYYLRSHSVSAG